MMYTAGRISDIFLMFLQGLMVGITINLQTTQVVTRVQLSLIFITADQMLSHGFNAVCLTTFEPSPLNRTIKQGFVGKVGQPNATNTYASTDHTLKKAYQLNGSNEVLKWTFTGPASGNPLGLVNAGTASSKTYYVANTLSRKKTKDENGNEVIQYEDMEGHVVLKRVQAIAGTPTIDDTNYASTYYIYNDLG